MTKPILIGEAPSQGGDRYHTFPLSGPPARVLCLMAEIPPVPGGTTYGRWTWALYDRFECVNLFERYADAAKWSAPRARERARALADGLRGRVVVCLGRRVQRAVQDALEIPAEVRSPHFHDWAVLDGTSVAAIPHPSGLNRALNDDQERARCGRTLRRALEVANRTSSA